MKTKELLRRLKAAGATVIPARGKGGHHLVFHGGRQTTVPHHSADLGNVFCKMVCKQLGLDPKEVL